jgi:hypothetical protein
MDAFLAPQGFARSVLAAAPWRVLAPDGTAVDGLKLERKWKGPVCVSRLTNPGGAAVKVGNIVVFDVQHGLPATTGFYGEGFQMLTQNGGTVGAPADLGNYTDPKHYKLPQPEGSRVVYGAAIFADTATHHLLGFGSCRRFTGALHVRPASVQVVQEAEGLTLAPGQSWELEEFTFDSGTDRAALFDALATRLTTNHPPLIRQSSIANPCLRQGGARGTASARASPHSKSSTTSTSSRSRSPVSSTSRSTTDISRRWGTGSRPGRRSAAPCRRC